MTEYSIEERLDADALWWGDYAGRKASLERSAAAEIRRLRETLENVSAERDTLLSGRDDALQLAKDATEELERDLTAETARRESAEALLLAILNASLPVTNSSIRKHFARYASTGSGDTKEHDR